MEPSVHPHRRLTAAILGGALVLAPGCASSSAAPDSAVSDRDASPGSPVGASCFPMNVPFGGFGASEYYLETSTSACETTVCLVDQLEGDPRMVQGSDSCGDGGACVTAEDIEERIYCTCRCDVPFGVDGEACACPEGFVCERILELGGDDVRGGYCVRARGG